MRKTKQKCITFRSKVGLNAHACHFVGCWCCQVEMCCGDDNKNGLFIQFLIKSKRSLSVLGDITNIFNIPVPLRCLQAHLVVDWWRKKRNWKRTRKKHGRMTSQQPKLNRQQCVIYVRELWESMSIIESKMREKSIKLPKDNFFFCCFASTQ